MRIFLYEFVTGGGWYWHGSQAPPVSLLAEGSAMQRALAADLSALDGVQVEVLRDRRFRDLPLPQCIVHEVSSAEEEWRSFQQSAAAADWSLVVAPEFRGYLQRRTEAVEQRGGRLLGPGSRLVALAGDKHATAEHLAARGVQVPPGVALAPHEPLPPDFTYPAVLKPRDGAGSQGIERVVAADRVNGPKPARLEQLCEGMAASVAVLCGPRQIVPLAPCLQSISVDGRFTYQGGSLPISGPLARRAIRLATTAAHTLSDPLGYLGVDLILGNDPAGADDVVIEINPRVTTSYVGLRELVIGNLAEMMLVVAGGGQVELCWKSGSIQFEAAGRVCRK